MGKPDLTARHVYQVAKKHFFPAWGQWMHLPSLLSKRESSIARLSLLTGTFSLLISGGLFYFTHLTTVPSVGGEYTEGLVGEPRFVNPILSPGSSVDRDLTRLVFRGLFLFDPVEERLVPDLAATYEINEDGSVYTVRLREGAFWHDGKPLTSRDVAFTFGAIVDTEYRSPLSASFRGVQVETPDDLTVVFTLPEPFTSFLASLDVGILPSHLWESVAPRRAHLANLNLQPVGNGPYRFEKFSKDQNGVIRSYTLTRSKNFYGRRPLIETLTFKFYPDADSALEALKNRNIEGLAFLSEEGVKDFEGSRVVRVLRPALPQTTALFMNETRNPALQDLKVRQALNLVLDRPGMVERVFGGQATPLAGPFLPNGLVTIPEITPPDIEKAEALLDATPWKRNPLTHMREAAGKEGEEARKLKIEITTTDAGDLLALSEEIKNAWMPLGIEVSVKSVPPSAFQSETIKPRAFDVLLTGILYGADHDPFPFWHSSQVNDPGVNLAQYSNRKADAALETGRSTMDAAARAEAYQTFQDIILEDLPAIFLLEPTYRYATADKIRGLELQRIVNPSDRFNRVEYWYTNTKRSFRASVEETSR